MSEVRELAPAPDVPEDNATQELDASQIEEAYAIARASAPRSIAPPLPGSVPHSVRGADGARLFVRTLVYFVSALARRIGRVLASEWQDARRRALES